MRELIIAAVIAVTAFGASWKVQDWRYGDQINQIKAEAAEANEKALKHAAAETEEMQRKKDEALDEANKRAQENAVAAAAADHTAISLRQQLAKARASLPQVSCEASRNYAATITDIFSQCTERLTEMAGIADQATSAAMTLDQAWSQP